MLNSLLFTLGHFWQPYHYSLIFLLVLPEGFPVYWKRNIKISILLHCTGNTFAALRARSERSTIVFSSVWIEKRS